MLLQRWICQFNYLFIISLHCSWFLWNSQVLNRALLHNKIEIKITRILYHNCLASLFIDIDLPKIDWMMFLVIQRSCWGWELNTVVEGITYSLDVQRYRSCFLLDITQNVVVIFSLNSWLECDLDCNLAFSSNDSWHWTHIQGISILRISWNALFVKSKAERNVFQVFDVNCFFIPSL